MRGMFRMPVRAHRQPGFPESPTTSGLPVVGSGVNVSILSRNVRGTAAKNIGVLIMVICCRLPWGSLDSSAMPRGLSSASGACGSPPARENRATTGTASPANNAERDYAAASNLPTNAPRAQVPLV